MDDERKEKYQKLTEKIFSKPPAERQRFLKKIRERDLEYYERIEHLIRFLVSRDDDLKGYAHDQIKRILDDLDDVEI